MKKRALCIQQVKIYKFLWVVDTYEIIDELFDTMLQRFQEARETSFERGSEVIFDNVDLLYFCFHRIDMKRSRSYMEPPE